MNIYKNSENIIHISAEVFPFSKKGGLGDVVGTLPKYLYKYTKIKNIVISPYYRNIKEEVVYLSEYEVTFKGVPIKYRVYSCNCSNIDYYFIALEDIFSIDETYINDNRAYNEEVGLQYFVFGKCVFNFISKMHLKKVTIFTHDWHVAAVYPYLHLLNEIKKTIHVIHNYHFQGEFYFDIVDYLDDDIKKEVLNQYNKFHYCNMSLFALMNADRLITVSPNYATELINKKAPHTSLDAIAYYKDKLKGILNGVDYNVWNPSKDNLIYKKYDSASIHNKKENKLNLYKELGVQYEINKPLVIYVNRPTPQKGIDLFVNLKSGKPFNINERMMKLLDKDVYFILCGNCENKSLSPVYSQLSSLDRALSNFKFIDNYTEEIAHKLFAAADIFIMPSRYEPCGLSQLYALAYGVVPIVNSVGGLVDTVVDINDNKGCGTGMLMKEFSFDSLVNLLGQLVSIYKDAEEWNKLRIRCTEQNFSWDQCIESYVDEIY